MRSLGLGFGAASAALALVACTSLLGDFDVSATTTGPDGSSPTDADTTDGTVSPSDAATEAEASLPPLVCKPAAAPVRLDTTTNGVSFIPPIRAYRANNQTRVIALKKGVAGFTVYTFGSGGGPQINSVPPPATPFPGQVYDAQPIPGGIGVLVFEPLPAPSQGSRFVIYKVLDSNAGAAPDIVGVIPTSAGAAGLTAATFSAFGADDYFVAATFDVGGGNAEVRALRRKQGAQPGAPQPVGSAPMGGDSRIKDIARIGNFAILFNDKGPEQGKPGAAGYFRVSDEPTSPSSTAVTALSRTADRPVVTFGAASAPTGLRLAVGEINFGAGTGRLLAGGLGPADLTPVDVTKLPVAYNLSTFFDAPINGGDARWVTTDFLAVGTSLGGGGLNFFWYDAQNATMRAALVGAQKLVPDRTPTYSTLAPRSLVGGLGDIDLVWAEAPDAGGIGTLFTQQIVCARAN